MAAAQPLIMMLMMFGIFYFLLIRPQVKRQRQHQEVLNKLTVGDTIVTNGGLIAKITGINDTEITIELQEKVRVRMLRASIQGKYDTKSRKVDGAAA